MTASPWASLARRVPADGAVALDAHRVAGGVQGLAADHDRVQVELVLLGRPAAVADTAVELEQLDRVDAAAPGHAVLAVGGERHVVGAQRPPGPDLGGFLPEQRGPDAELALALQGDRLGVDPADEHEVPVQAPDVGGGQVQRVVGVVDPLTLRGKQLDESAGLVGPVRRGLIGQCLAGWCWLAAGACWLASVWLGAAVVAAPDSTVTCHSFPGRDWDHQYRPDGLGFPDACTAELSRTLRARVGRARPRSVWDAPHLTIYALMALEDTCRG